jgi:hypothetical protein
MNLAPIQCPKCKGSVFEGVFNQNQLFPCPACSTPLQIEIFPALFRPVATGRAGEIVMTEGESSCFFHPNKRAVLPCHSCGRFLCALCDCELNGEHFCPTCLEAGKTKGKIKTLENQRVLHDSVALSLAVLPLLMWPLTFLTAPMTLYLGIRHWNSPRSIVHGTRIRLILAILIASLQVIGWSVFVYFLLTRRNG